MKKLPSSETPFSQNAPQADLRRGQDARVPREARTPRGGFIFAFLSIVFSWSLCQWNGFPYRGMRRLDGSIRAHNLDAFGLFRCEAAEAVADTGMKVGGFTFEAVCGLSGGKTVGKARPLSGGIGIKEEGQRRADAANGELHYCAKLRQVKTAAIPLIGVCRVIEPVAQHPCATLKRGAYHLFNKLRAACAEEQRLGGWNRRLAA